MAVKKKQTKKPAGPTVKMLDLHAVRTDGETQARVQLDDATIDEYVEALKEGVTFPPVVVFYDGKHYWLADGFHRWHTFMREDHEKIHCEVHKGSKREALLYAVGANADHGLKRSNADKREAVLTLLHDDEWSKWSDREISRKCRVSAPLVSKLRKEMTTMTVNVSSQDRTYTHNKSGQPTTMNTTNIGSKPEPVGVASFDDDPPADWRETQLAELAGVSDNFINALASWTDESDPNVGLYIEGLGDWKTIDEHSKGLIAHADKTGLPLAADEVERADDAIGAFVLACGGTPSKGADDPEFDGDDAGTERHHDQATDDEDAGLGLDAVGHVIHEPAIQRAFDLSADMFQKAQQHIQAARKLLNSAGHTQLATHLHAQDIDRDLKNAWEAVKFAAPYAICPKCNGKHCSACKKLGWLPKAPYDTLTKAKGK